MKIKLNHKQIESIRRELKKTERRGFKLDDVSQVFRMLQYWSKSIGGKDVKIQSVAELADGYMCRVNSKFRERMKAYLKHIRQQRIEKHEQNALEVARFLESHPRVTKVRYPGLPSHPQHELAKRQMSGFSGMLNFSLDCELLENFEFIKRLELITHAVSLGHDQSLLMYIPTTFFFQDMVELSDERKLKYWDLMGDGLFRFSVGIENLDLRWYQGEARHPLSPTPLRLYTLFSAPRENREWSAGAMTPGAPSISCSWWTSRVRWRAICLWWCKHSI